MAVSTRPGVAWAKGDWSAARSRSPSGTPVCLTYALPVVPADRGPFVTGVCDLAAALHAAAGFIAVEPSYALAHRAALGGSRPKERVGLSEQRFRERRGRGRFDDRLSAELAGVEWGTFLEPGHLAKIDLGSLRRSGAFAQVVEVTPGLAYLQVTEDPMDDLTEGFEPRHSDQAACLPDLHGRGQARVVA